MICGARLAESSSDPKSVSQRSRMLLRPEAGFYVINRSRRGLLVWAMIFLLCPMVIPHPTVADAPNPEDGYGKLNGSLRLHALVDDKPVSVGSG